MNTTDPLLSLSLGRQALVKAVGMTTFMLNMDLNSSTSQLSSVGKRVNFAALFTKPSIPTEEFGINRAKLD